MEKIKIFIVKKVLKDLKRYGLSEDFVISLVVDAIKVITWKSIIRIDFYTDLF